MYFLLERHKIYALNKYKCRWLRSKRERILIIYNLGCAGGFSGQLGTADVQHRNADVPQTIAGRHVDVRLSGKTNATPAQIQDILKFDWATVIYTALLYTPQLNARKCVTS